MSCALINPAVKFAAIKSENPSTLFTVLPKESMSSYTPFRSLIFRLAKKSSCPSGVPFPAGGGAGGAAKPASVSLEIVPHLS